MTDDHHDTRARAERAVNQDRPTKETRIYPVGCTSAFCGRIDCTGCSRAPERHAFEAWRERTHATRPDPIWCPLVWCASGNGGDR
jgi:hypothetical protein